MKWQVFVRVGITNTSPTTNNTTNKDAVAVTNAIRSHLEGANLSKKAKRKTATFRGEFATVPEVTAVASALKQMLDEIVNLEGSSKKARLDNVWVLVNREDDDQVDPGDGVDETEEEVEASAEAETEAPAAG